MLLAATPVERSAKWMAAFPTEQLKYDSAVGLSQLLKLTDSPDLRAAHAHARSVADRDSDHPHRRFFDSAAKVPKSAVTSWAVTDPKINLNRVVDEALWCDVHGLRPATVTYAGGAMRDGGGYRSTHALWALVIARERGCLDVKAFDKASAAVRAELRKTQPAEPGPGTMDVDLYSERLLFLLLAGEHDAVLEGWAKKLAARQNDDGSWGSAGERPYEQFHATMVATWALVVSSSYRR